ncbi:hypothetical protein ACFZB9_15025 [Kitasatospora sp. NPDC008050]|uniref:hypothetical protein n=1 Tax=Kitasatospora sp. NPDC008050 TaxID=3364021 RepID=UPI0036E71606
MTRGVLSHTTAAGSWAWVGLRLAPARSLHAHRGYADVPEDERRRQAGAAELAWLGGLCRPGEAVRFDLRYVSEPGRGLLRCVLLGQAAGATPQAAQALAGELRGRLAQLPPHVVGQEITEEGELPAELDPFGGAAGAGPEAVTVVELRKRLTALPLSRTDTDRSHAVLAHTIVGPGASWEPFWAALAGRPGRTVLSVALAAQQLARPELDELARYAQEYQRLAAPARTASTWQLARQADPAAHAAAGCLAQAVQRAVRPGYRMRLTLAGAEPQQAGSTLELANLLAGLLGGPADPAAVLPVAAAERAAALANLAAVNLEPLPQTYAQGLPPGHYGWVEQTLSAFGDLGEAAGVLRLPYQVLSHRPLFDDRFLAAGPPPAAPPRPPAAPPRPPGPAPARPQF